MKLLIITLSLIVILFVGCTEPNYDNEFDPNNNNNSEEYYENVGFLQNLDNDIEIVQGDRLELTVSWHGFAKEIHWYQNDMIISTDIVEGERQDATFLRDNAQAGADDGTYKCVIIKGDNSEVYSNSIHVTINYDNGGSASIENGPVDQNNIALNAYVEFAVKINGQYDSLKWFKDGVYLTDNPTKQSEVLEISSVSKDDEGSYHCKVWFTGYTDFMRSNDAQLTIKTATSNLVFYQDLPNERFVVEESDVSFIVEVRDFVGGVTYTWKMSDDMIPSSDDNTLASGPANSYTILKVNFADHGGKWIYCHVKDQVKDIRSNMCQIKNSGGGA